jgi:hypothetical protein
LLEALIFVADTHATFRCCLGNLLLLLRADAVP